MGAVSPWPSNKRDAPPVLYRKGQCVFCALRHFPFWKFAPRTTKCTRGEKMKTAQLSRLEVFLTLACEKDEKKKEKFERALSNEQKEDLQKFLRGEGMRDPFGLKKA